MKKFVDVILPLPLPRYFTYSLSEEWADEVQMGCRVVVPFGRKKYYTAIVRNVHYCEPADYEVKEVSTLLDAHPILLPEQFKFWEWLADYYLCTQGDVYKAALPSGLKLESETMVEYNPDFESEVRLPEREQKILDLLSAEPEQCVTKLEKDSGLKNILSVIKSLLDKEAIFVKEELRRTYKPKTETRVRLANEVRNEKRLQELFDELARAPKQLDLLMKYIELSGILGGDGLKSFPKEVNKKELLLRASASPAVFNGLVDKHIFEVYQQEVGRLNSVLREILPINPLNDHQKMAHDEIVRSFQSKNVCLLHGVTASGKTEIYIHLIEETIRQGKQVLYLLPEIALTTQITERLQRVFGDRLGIYHSKFPDAERVEIWQKQLTEKGYDIILRIFNDEGEEEYMQYCSQIARYHHEKWNGKGYPQGLTGEDIPLCARIMSVADVFDAVSAKRCYRDAMPLEQCFEIIEKGSGQDFDPDIAEVFLDMRERIGQVVGAI